MRLGFTSCSVLFLDLLVDGDQISNPRSSCLSSCSWLMKWVGTKLNPSLENDQEHFLIFWNTGMWDDSVRLQETFSLLSSIGLAEFSLSLSLCFSCSTMCVTVQFFLSHILCIWVQKLLTLVQLGLGLFSNLDFGCIFINMSNPWNLFIKIPTSV